MPIDKMAFAVIVLLSLTAPSFVAGAAPTTGISSHRDRQTVRDGTITLSGTASDPAGIAAVTVSLNRGPYLPAEWNGSGGGQNAAVSWSIRLELSEGANIIVVNATNTANETSTRTILIDYSVAQSDNGGVFLAGGSIIAAIVLITLLAMRARRPPPPSEDTAAVVKVMAPKDPGE